MSAPFKQENEDIRKFLPYWAKELLKMFDEIKREKLGGKEHKNNCR